MREGKPVILTHTNFAGTPLTEREMKTRNEIPAEGGALPKRSVDVFGGLCERWGEHDGGLRAAGGDGGRRRQKMALPRRRRDDD